MQLAIAAIGKVFGALGLSGAGGGAIEAGTGLAAAGGGGSTVLTALQGLAAGAGILGQIGQGVAAARADRQAADQAELQAGQENVEATQRQTQMKRTLLSVLGENDVTFAAAGIDLSGGIADQARQQNVKRAASELSIDRRDQEFRSALYRARSRGLRRRAGSQVGGALLGALGTGADFGIKLYERG